MKIRLIFSLLILITIVSVRAQAPKFSNDFLNIGIGARALGMAAAVSSSTSTIYSTYWNPASLVQIESNLQIGAQHAEWFAGIGNYDYIGFGKKLDAEGKSFGAISIIRMGIDKIPNTLRLRGADGNIDYSRISEFSIADYAFTVSYGRKLSDKLSFGVNSKVINRNFGSFAKAWGFGFDAGLHFDLGHWKFALMGRDITTTFNAYKFSFSDDEKAILKQTNNIIPVSSVEYTLPKLILGLSRTSQITNKLGLLYELDTEVSTNGTNSALIALDNFNVDPRLGIEVDYSKKIYLRLGAGNFQRPLKDDGSGARSVSFYPTAGLGLRFKKFSIDYAMSNIASTGVGLYSHFISALINITPRKSITSDL